MEERIVICISADIYVRSCLQSQLDWLRRVLERRCIRRTGLGQQKPRSKDNWGDINIDVVGRVAVGTLKALVDVLNGTPLAVAMKARHAVRSVD